ncbi:MAG: DUF6290 family protein [Holosporales bacterium]|jgi:uncharacterized protein (DUF1778 family)|nr:DUF6290 family protein [Holosporales bacterium]
MLSIRVSPKDEELIKKFAKFKRLSVSTMIRNAVLEAIEDELDLKAFDDAMAEFEKNPITYTHEEIGEILGLV